MTNLKNAPVKLLKYLILILVFCSSSCKRNLDKQLEKKEQYKFEFKPVEPVNGTLKGIVELGTTGFNYFIAEIDTLKNWKLKKSVYGKSFLAEEMTTPEEINEKLESYLNEIEKEGVKKNATNVVVSSGALQVDLTALILKRLEEKQYNVTLVSPEEEATYALKAILPKEFYKNSFVVDIGSGNTKLSYFEKGKFVTIDTHGSKYHQKGEEDQKVLQDVRTLVTSIPKEHTKYAFIVGGIPYELAKDLRKNKERYTPLIFNKKEIENLFKVSGRRVQSGLTIYKGILEGTGCKSFIFDWEANFSIGYLLEN